MADHQTNPAVEEETAPAAVQEVDRAEVIQEDLTNLTQRLQEQEQIAADNHDKFLRTMSDFDNYRRRTRQEMEDARLVAIEKFVADLLQALEALARALQHPEGTGGGTAVREGILVINRQLMDTVAKHGVEPIEAV